MSDGGTPGAPRGLFIVFEGPEGAGKSTQIARLAAHLRGLGRTVVTTREPGGTDLGRALRALVLTPGNRVGPMAEFLLYAADRAQHVADVIAPALAAGSDVIGDRYTAASVAYQGHGRGLDVEFVATVNRYATEGLRPDLTVLLDIEPASGLDRVAKRDEGERDRLESEHLDFHLRVRQGYLRLAREEPGWLVVDAERSLDEVAAEVSAAASSLLREGHTAR